MSALLRSKFGKSSLVVIALLLASCGDRSATPPTATDTAAQLTAAAGSPEALPGTAAEGLCQLLTLGEVAAVFPGAEAGVVTKVPVEGVTACTWAIPAGRFVLQSWPAKDPVADEMKGLTFGVLDPFKPTDGLIHYETVTGVGDEALAVLTQKDEKRGILSDAAILVARRGDKILVILSDDLPQRDHAQALAALQSLDSSAAGRMQ